MKPILCPPSASDTKRAIFFGALVHAIDDFTKDGSAYRLSIEGDELIIERGQAALNKKPVRARGTKTPPKAG